MMSDTATMTDRRPVVRVQQGLLQGEIAQTDNKFAYSAFRGVPYARPPVGALRFQPPVEPESWSDVRDATKEGNVAPQLEDGNFVGDEDCLYLNIYTPQDLLGGDIKVRAVMVWIHGGYFTVGSSSAQFYGPDFLIEEDVVIVTINYRLGVLGFLSTGDSVVPGNMGLKDQVMALRWIKNNISVFGGNPDNVTLFGNSAGAMSVHYHTVSPLSKGLFHRVIAQSGVCISFVCVSPKVAERSFRLGEYLGLKKRATSQELVDFLREQKAEKLVDSVLKFRSTEEKELFETLPFKPTIEPENSTGEAFIIEHPLAALTRGNFARVPIIIGITNKEGLVLKSDFVEEPSVISAVNSAFYRVIPTNLPHSAAVKARHFYLENNAFSRQTLSNVLDLRADSMFMYPCVKAANIHAALSPPPVYMYCFEVEGKRNFFKKVFNAEEFPGASHADELGYLWDMPAMKAARTTCNTVENKTIAALTRMWTNFAKTGDPTPQTDEVVPVKWTPYTVEVPCFLRIAKDLQMDINIFQNRYNFWAKLYRDNM